MFSSRKIKFVIIFIAAFICVQLFASEPNEPNEPNTPKTDLKFDLILADPPFFKEIMPDGETAAHGVLCVIIIHHIRDPRVDGDHLSDIDE